MKLFSPYHLGNIEVKNRVVMAPMTRSRAIDNIPNELMTTYYLQRAEAGLIITEGTAPSANGLGYPRIPGIYNKAQIKGWRQITSAVHAKGGKIFLQIMHTGRVSHPDNMEDNSKILAPSAVAMSGEMYTDKNGMQPHPTPSEMTFEEIQDTISEYSQAAANAMEAGFDGVELHAANGYLIDQFINTASNKRTDEYGGIMENRCRFALEVAQSVADRIGSNRTGIRLSPYGVYNDMEIFPAIDNTFEYLADELGELDLAYIHIVDHSGDGAPNVPERVKEKIRTTFGGDIIASGGMTKTKAEAVLQENRGSLVAFGKTYLANPDLIYRFQHDLPLNEVDFDTFFTPGEKGYTDYPAASLQPQLA